jgi:hypothetical protein
MPRVHKNNPVTSLNAVISVRLGSLFSRSEGYYREGVIQAGKGHQEDRASMRVKNKLSLSLSRGARVGGLKPLIVAMVRVSDA